MNLLLIIFILLLYSIIFIFSQNGIKNFMIKFNLLLVFNLGLFLYMVYPALYFLIFEDLVRLDYIYIFDVLIVLSIYFIALLIFRSFNSKQIFSFRPNSFISYKNPLLNHFLVINLIINSLLLIYYFEFSYGSIENYLGGDYGWNQIGGNLLTTIIPYIFVSHIFLSTRLNLLLNKLLSSLNITFILLIITFFFVGGNRNISIFLLLSFICGKFYNKSLSIRYLLPLGLIFAIFVTVVPFIRQFGLINFINGSISIDLLFQDFESLANPVNSEFGVPYRFSTIYSTLGFNNHYYSMFSYLILPIINLLPISLFSFLRLNTLGQNFAYFMHNENDPFLIGYGFSPIFEAKLNLGFLWFMIFFILFLFAIKLIHFKKFPFIEISFTIVIANFFRIDFAVFFKLFFTTFIFIFIYSWLLKNFFRVDISRIKY